MFTTLGLFILPLYLWSMVHRPLVSIPIVLVIVSIFQGGAIINLSVGGSYVGISPYYFLAVIFCIYIAFKLMTDHKISWPKAFTPFLALLLIFSLFSILTAFFLPHLFAGMPVYVPRAGIDSQVDAQGQLMYSFSNFGQAIYLFINTLITIFLASKRWTWADFENTINALHMSAFIAISVAIYEFIAHFSGFPSPDTLLQSNLGGAQLNDTFFGAKRLNSTFSESSNFASFLAGYIAYLLIVFMGRQEGIKNLVILIVAVACTLATTSSTAYVSLAMLFVVFFFNRWIHPLLARFRLKRIDARGLLLILGVLIAVSVVVFTIEDIFDIILNATFGKTESISYTNRTESNWYALTLLKETAGLGVGLGSNRPSSFAAWLLSNVGIFGSVVFMLTFYYLISWTLRVAHRLPHFDRKRVLLTALVCGFMTHAFAKIISQPDLAMPTFWTWVFLLVIGLRAYLGDSVFGRKFSGPGRLH